MSKMCSLSKSMRGTDGEAYINLMKNPMYFCKRCGRVADSKDYLCRPQAIREEKNDNHIKEVDIAVTRDGIQKHYYMEKVEENNKAINNEEDKIENSLKDEEKECCLEEKPEENKIHISELFENEEFLEEILEKKEKCMKKNKKIKKMKINDLRKIIREEIRNVLKEEKGE